MFVDSSKIKDSQFKMTNLIGYIIKIYNLDAEFFYLLPIVKDARSIGSTNN